MKSDLEKAIAFAKSEGYKGAKYLGVWCGLKIYSADNGNEVRCIGMPQYITIDRKGNADLLIDSDLTLTEMFY